MSERGSAGSESDPNRRQLLGLLGVTGLTALSATLVATGTSIEPDDNPDDESETADDDDGEGPGEAEEPAPSLSVEWNSIYGDEQPSTFASAQRAEEGFALAGVRLDEDDAGVGWLVQSGGPDTETTDLAHTSALNRSRRQIDEGYAIHDAVETILRVEDGWLLVGWTHDISPDSKSAWLRRINENGGLQWEKQYGRPGVNSFRDVFFDGVATDDGGAMLAGVTLGSEFVDTRRGDGWLAKVAPGGELEWDRTYNTADTTIRDWTKDERHDRFTTIESTETGYLLAGTTTPREASDTVPSEPWIVGVDADGQKLWDTFDERDPAESGERQDRVMADIAPADSGYLAVGTVGNYEYARSFRSNVFTGEGWIASVEGESFGWQRRLEATSIRTVERLDEEHYLLGGEQDGFAWVGIIRGDGELIDERRLHDVEGDVRATTGVEEGRIIVAGRRTQDDIPVGFAAGISGAAQES